LRRAEALANAAKFTATVSLNCGPSKADSEEHVTDWQHTAFFEGAREDWHVARTSEYPKLHVLRE
jgi:hypothetical protein